MPKRCAAPPRSFARLASASNESRPTHASLLPTSEQRETTRLALATPCGLHHLSSSRLQTTDQSLNTSVDRLFGLRSVSARATARAIFAPPRVDGSIGLA